MSGLEERVIKGYRITQSKRKCEGCGEMKSDVKFRTWSTFDGSEWEFLCASCGKKKSISYFSITLTLWGIATFAVFVGLMWVVVFGAFG